MNKTHWPRRVAALLTVVGALCATAAQAQTPGRFYLRGLSDANAVPVIVNSISGNTNPFDPAHTVTPGANFDATVALVGYAHTFSLLDRSAIAAIIVPMGRVSGDVTVNGRTFNQSASGFGDPMLEFNINLIGPKAQKSIPDALRYEPPPITLLDGSTALVLGYGAIGRRLARACQALGMTVLATRRSATTVSHDGVAEVHPAADLPSLLPLAGVLLITLPLTPQTTGLIGSTELALLPTGAVLINVGRGAIVDEDALFQALQQGHLAAAGIDVWWRYPENKAERVHTPPSAYPFHELDNVVMSPHRAGMGGVDRLERRRYIALAEALNQAARGHPLPNRIDPARGY